MRILHVTDCYLPRVGGIEIQVQELAHRQALSGHDVHVITATAEAEGADDWPLTVHRAGRVGRRRGDPLGPLPSFRRVGEVIERIDPDVVHVHVSVVSPLAGAAAVASARAARPTVVTVHSLWAYLSSPYRLAAGLARLGGLPIEWTAVSASAAAQVRHVVGPSRDVRVMPNGIDAAYWRELERADGGPDVVVAAVMRLTARKRPLALLAALRRTRAALSPDIGLRAVIMGDGPQREVMGAYLGAHRMRGWVELPGTGSREQVRRLLAESDVFVAAARLESFGIAALEARCAGVPVIAHMGTGIADFVRHGRDGLLVSGDGLGAALGRLTGAPEVRRAMATLSRSSPPALGWPVTLAAAHDAYRRAAALTRPAGVTLSAAAS
jgi:glycosyltransferase involved in cell wall biosynthesis